MRGFFIVICLALVGVVGCSRKVAPSTKTEERTVVRDSIIIREIPRIDTVTVPGEKIVVREVIECDSVTNKPKAKTFKAKGEKAFVNVTIDEHGNATATGGCDDLKKAIIARDREIFRLRQEQQNSKKEVTKTQIIYKTRRVDIFCRLFTGLALLFLLAVITYKIKTLKFF
jgi:hypothetical protein